jgi:hypothetical protein
MTLQSIEFDQPADARLLRLRLGRFAKGVLSPRCTVRRQLSAIARRPDSNKWFALRAGGVVNRRQQHRKA